MGEYLSERRKETTNRLEEIRGALEKSHDLANGCACVYVTGSYGRGEAGRNSDLDLFIVGEVDGEKRILTRLDEICIKADLIETTRQLGIQEFSGDGEYLQHYTVPSLIKALGRPEDDASNTFTARLLMLLESKPLVGADVYSEAIKQVIAACWGDFEDHSTEFIPGFLANDILRLWRTFCVNYEARTAREPKEKKAKRKLKNYKLKHSRLLTCYSALAYLSAVFCAEKTVTPGRAKEMVSLTPTERIEALRADFSVDAEHVEALIASYETFLRNTDVSETELVERFMDSHESRLLFNEANEFGDKMWGLLQTVGPRTRFHRLLTV